MRKRTGKQRSSQEQIAYDYQIESHTRGEMGRKDKKSVIITPQEAVDFINKSIAYVLKREFGAELGDENVHVLDPFAGTGIFAASMMEGNKFDGKPLIKPEKMEQFAENLTNIEVDPQGAAICKENLERVYEGRTGQKKSMKVMCADTFTLDPLALKRREKYCCKKKG